MRVFNGKKKTIFKSKLLNKTVLESLHFAIQSMEKCQHVRTQGLITTHQSECFHIAQNL